MFFRITKDKKKHRIWSEKIFVLIILNSCCFIGGKLKSASKHRKQDVYNGENQVKNENFLFDSTIGNENKTKLPKKSHCFFPVSWTASSVRWRRR